MRNLAKFDAAGDSRLQALVQIAQDAALNNQVRFTAYELFMMLEHNLTGIHPLTRYKTEAQQLLIFQDEINEPSAIK